MGRELVLDPPLDTLGSYPGLPFLFPLIPDVCKERIMERVTAENSKMLAEKRWLVNGDEAGDEDMSPEDALY